MDRTKDNDSVFFLLLFFFFRQSASPSQQIITTSGCFFSASSFLYQAGSVTRNPSLWPFFFASLMSPCLVFGGAPTCLQKEVITCECKAMAFPLNLFKSFSPTTAIDILTAGAKMPSSKDKFSASVRGGGASFFPAFPPFPAEHMTFAFVLLGANETLHAPAALMPRGVDVVADIFIVALAANILLFIASFLFWQNFRNLRRHNSAMIHVLFSGNKSLTLYNNSIIRI